MMCVAGLPAFGSVYATSDLASLGSPDITISPTSGPPGTQVTITVSNIPDISKETYPYPDLYIYLPFSQSFGMTPQSQCGAYDCFPIYTHYDAANHDAADRTVTFSLFSTANPAPVYLNGLENSPCDVVVNGQTLERYYSLCNTKDQPAGTYAIKFAWAEENAPEINYFVKTVQFTVTPGTPAPTPQKVDNGNSIIEEYQNGQISESQFYSELTTLGWNPDEIRQALATIGKLPHQMGAPVPDEMQQIQQGVQRAAEQVNTQQEPQPAPANTETTAPAPAATMAAPPSESQPKAAQPVAEEQTAESLTPYKTDTSQAQAPQAGQASAPDTPPQNNFWTMVTIIASGGAASAVAGSIFVARRTRKVTN